jgi:hypothetical protein
LKPYSLLAMCPMVHNAALFLTRGVSGFKISYLKNSMSLLCFRYWVPSSVLTSSP